MRSAHIGSRMAGKAFDACNIVLLSLVTILCIYPFYYIFVYSLSDPLAAQGGVTLLPVEPTLQNYKDIFALSGISQAFLISVLRTVLGTVVTLVCCTFFAYLVTKEELPLRKSLYRFLIVTMYFNAGLIPWYLTMKSLHLTNHFLVYILPTAISAYFVILIKTFIEQLPPALEESAKIDGAGYTAILFRIIVPLSGPIIATIAVFSAVNQWNTWIDNYFLVQSPRLQTLQLVLYDYLKQANKIASLSELSRGTEARQLTPESVRMTITMVVTLPVLFVYPFMQRYFVKGLMLGAIKG